MAEQGRGRLHGVKLGFIGAGNMGEALIWGLLASGKVAKENLVFYDPDPARQENMKQKYGLAAEKDNPGVMQAARVVILAVKPQMSGKVLAEIQEVAHSGHLIISILAGVPLASLEGAVPGARIIRVMPNTPTTVGAGMAALAPGSSATEEDLALALEIFGAVGRAVVLEEKHLDAVTGLSGSGPAYVALFIEGLADGGVKMGLPRAVALELAAQTVLGTARLCLECGLHPGALKDQVASPGGTTIEGIHELEKGGVRAALISAVRAAAAKAKQLG